MFVEVPETRERSLTQNSWYRCKPITPMAAIRSRLQTVLENNEVETRM